MDDKETEDILPDTNIDRDRTLTGKWALGIFTVVFILIGIAFCTPSWIAGDPKFYGTKVEEVGLWVHCFRSMPDYNDYQHRRFFAGCRWIFNPFTVGYDGIRSFLAPPFFVATQFFYTICFMGVLLALILIVMYLLCIQDHYRVTTLRWTGIDLIVSAILGTLALLIFGIMGDGKEFMPDWEHNYLSWSYGLAFVGVFFAYVDGILFIVEARIMQRKEIAREMRFPMEQRV